MHDRQKIGSCHIEERTPGKSGCESREYLVRMREQKIGKIKSNRGSKSETKDGSDLKMSRKSGFFENSRKREGYGNLMNGNACKYGISEGIRDTKSGTDSKTIKNRVDKYCNSGHESHVVIVLMRILMGMVAMVVVVLPVREKLFYEIDKEKSRHEGIDCQMARFQRLRKDMHKRNCKHGSSPERDQEV